MSEIKKRSFEETFVAVGKEKADLILTDPPYAISRDTGFAKYKGGNPRYAVSMDFGEWDQQEIDVTKCMKMAHSSLRKGGTAIVWYDLWKAQSLAQAMQEAGFKMLRMIHWIKTNPVPLNSKRFYLTNAREIAVCGVKGGKPTFHGEYDNGEYRYPIPQPKGGRIHPTQKPVPLFADLVAKHSNKGDLVVDPFLGSGTTAIAAKDLGRRFTGGDISEQYVEAARRRTR